MKSSCVYVCKLTPYLIVVLAPEKQAIPVKCELSNEERTTDAREGSSSPKDSWEPGSKHIALKPSVACISYQYTWSCHLPAARFNHSDTPPVLAAFEGLIVDATDA